MPGWLDVHNCIAIGYDFASEVCACLDMLGTVL